jgi:membrane protein
MAGGAETDRKAPPGRGRGAGRSLRVAGLYGARWLSWPIKALVLRIVRLSNRMSDRELSLIAAGVAFFGFLAIFPAVAALIALWGLAADPAVIRAEVQLLADILPPDAFRLVSGQVDALLAANNRSFGWATAISTLLALWSARAGIAALIQGINAIHGYPQRDTLSHTALALLLTLVLIALTMLALALTVVAPVVIAFLPLARVEALALELMNLGLGLLLVSAIVAILYHIGPNRADHPRPPILSRGLLVALVLWAAVSRGLVLYLTNFPSYNQVYGSIGAVAALLLWFYLSAYSVLLGAAVDAERARRRLRRQ